MAKKEAAKPAKETKTAAPAAKFGVKDLAEALDIEPAAARIKLRNAGVKKSDSGSYGWNTKDELKAVVDQLKAKKEKSAPAAKEKASTKKDAPAKETKKASPDKGKDKAAKKSK